MLEEEVQKNIVKNIFYWDTVPFQLHVLRYLHDNCPADMAIPRVAVVLMVQFYPCTLSCLSKYNLLKAQTPKPWGSSHHPSTCTFWNPCLYSRFLYLLDLSKPYLPSGLKPMTTSTMKPSHRLQLAFGLFSLQHSRTDFVCWFNAGWDGHLLVCTLPELSIRVTFRQRSTWCR